MIEEALLAQDEKNKLEVILKNVEEEKKNKIYEAQKKILQGKREYEEKVRMLNKKNEQKISEIK